MENQSVIHDASKKALFLTGLLFLCISLLGCSPTKHEHTDETWVNNVNQSITTTFQVGDWIVRAGTGHESQLIMKLSGSEFSHIGVITQVTPEVRIVHATTDDKPSQKNQVIESSLGEFTHHSLASKWAVYRYLDMPLAKMQQMAIEVEQKQGLPFILDTQEHPHRYCTSIIAESLPLAVQNKLTWQTVNFPGFKGKLLYPNAFLHLQNTHLIYQSDALPVI